MQTPEIIRLISAIILFVGAIVLVVIVLIQSNSSKGLSGTIVGGSETFYGKNKGKSTEKKLLVATIVIASIFLVLCLVVYALQPGLTLLIEQLKDQGINIAK